MPKCKGGLGVIDPQDQSKASLVKLMIRGLLPGNEIWKTLLKNRLQDGGPSTGGLWPMEIRWKFVDGIKWVSSKKWEDRFFNSLFQAWKQMRSGLLYKKIQGVEELHRQPLMWNPLFTSTAENMLEMRTKVAWGPFTNDIARTYQDWKLYVGLPSNVKEQKLIQYRGGKNMYVDI